MEGLTAEQKASQIVGTVQTVEGEPITPELEFAILEGKGVEYKVGDFSIIVPPLKIKDYRGFDDLQKKIMEVKTGMEVSRAQVEYISKICKVSVEDLEENFLREDCDNTLNLMLYSWLEGRGMYKKKLLKMSEVIKKIYGPMKNNGEVSA